MRNSRLEKLRTKVDEALHERDYYRRKLNEALEALKEAHLDETATVEAQEIIQIAAQATQQKLAYHIAEPVSLALATVFDDPYEMRVSFEMRRGRTEADMFFIRDGEEISPLDASGGGAIDVASFGLRVALFKLSTKNGMPVLLLDEPFRFVSRNLRERASQLLKDVSKRLDLQVIAITHDPRLAEKADLGFQLRPSSSGVVKGFLSLSDSDDTSADEPA